MSPNDGKQVVADAMSKPLDPSLMHPREKCPNCTRRLIEVEEVGGLWCNECGGLWSQNFPPSSLGYG